MKKFGKLKNAVRTVKVMQAFQEPTKAKSPEIEEPKTWNESQIYKYFQKNKQ